MKKMNEKKKNNVQSITHNALQITNNNNIEKK